MKGILIRRYGGKGGERELEEERWRWKKREESDNGGLRSRKMYEKRKENKKEKGERST